MLKPNKKKRVVGEFKTHDKDTGSAEVQVALLTHQMNELTSHLKKHSQDNHSRRGLLKIVSKRRKFLAYLSKKNPESYQKVIKKLGIRK